MTNTLVRFAINSLENIHQMNKIYYALFAFVFTIYSCPAKASTYYISSSSGSDNNTLAQARNPATPWKTLDKVGLSWSLINPGDSILFKRGDTFTGTLKVTKSGTPDHPISIGAYGEGTEKPVIDGRLLLNNWVSLGGNVWETSNVALTSQPTALTINDVLQPLGRYPNLDAPNLGYLTITSHPAGSKNTFTDSSLSASPNWTGAEVVVRNAHWVLNRLTASGHSGQTITLSGATYYEIKDNYGYFFQNHPATLDINGEWCYLSTDKKIRVYSVSDPNTNTIKVANIDKLFDFSQVSNVVIDGLTMIGAKRLAINMSKTNSTTIKNCDIVASGESAITIGNIYSTNIECDSISLINNTFTNTQHNCISARASRLILKENTISNTGIVPGMSANGQGGVAIKLICTGVKVERNTIRNTGYVCIMHGCNDLLIKENILDNFCSVLDDGGAIYGQNDGTNRKIIHNMVLNGIGAPAGANRTGGMAEGIYLDDRTSNVEVEGNSVAFCASTGIFLHNAQKSIVKNNIVFSCGMALRLKHDNIAADSPIIDCDIQNNTLCTNNLASNSALLYYQSRNESDLSRLGILDNNYYWHPYLHNQYIIYRVYDTSTIVYTPLNIAEWKAVGNFDTHSVAIGPNNASDSFRFEYNTTSSSKSIVADKKYETPQGTVYEKGSTITIPAFKSVVLKPDLTTSIGTMEISKNCPFKLYPNPVSNRVYIQGNPEDNAIEVELFDLSGKMLKKEFIASGASIDVSTLPKGIYAVQISDSKNLQTLKLVKQ